MATGAWQHFLPAAYIAGFGDESYSGQRSRKTPVWVARRGGSVFQQTAERVGAEKNLYTLENPSCLAINTNVDVSVPPFPLVSNSDRHVIDYLWSDVEQQLQTAIAALSDGHGSIDANLWGSVLVPFVAHMFVRSPDFGERHKNRVAVLCGDIPSPIPQDRDRANIARLIETRRLSGLAMRAEWSLVYAPPGAHFVTNDSGRALFRRDEPGTQVAHLIPLRRDIALQINMGKAAHRLSRGANDKWVIGPISTCTTDYDGVACINGEMAKAARTEIYGWPGSVVEELHRSMGQSPSFALAEPRLTVTTGEARLYEDLQLQLVQYIAKPPSQTPGPFVPSLNQVPAGSKTALKLMQFPLPGRPKEAISVPIQVLRLPVDEVPACLEPSGRPIDEETIMSKLVELASVAVVQGECVENLVFIRGADGEVCRYPYTATERDGWVARNRRSSCFMFIAGIDLSTNKLLLRHIEWIPVSGPYLMGSPISP
jgi:hypothetical protein